MENKDKHERNKALDDTVTFFDTRELKTSSEGYSVPISRREEGYERPDVQERLKRGRPVILYRIPMPRHS